MFGISDQVQHKPGCSTIEDGLKFRRAHEVHTRISNECLQIVFLVVIEKLNLNYDKLCIFSVLLILKSNNNIKQAFKEK